MGWSYPDLAVQLKMFRLYWRLKFKFKKDVKSENCEIVENVENGECGEIGENNKNIESIGKTLYYEEVIFFVRVWILDSKIL